MVSDKNPHELVESSEFDQETIDVALDVLELWDYSDRRRPRVIAATAVYASAYINNSDHTQESVGEAFDASTRMIGGLWRDAMGSYMDQLRGDDDG